MGLFESFRLHGWNTYYDDKPPAISFDLTQAFILYLVVVAGAAMMMVVVGTRGTERWLTFLRLLLSLHTGVVIIFCVFGRSWQEATLHGHFEYSPDVANGIMADIGLHLGLKSVNITLYADKATLPLPILVNYNEEFSFDHVVDIKEQFRESLYRGLPLPIICSLEYFNVDSGGLRWHRAVRASGHFTYIILWTSLVSWLISNILLCFVLSRGLVMLTVTGCLMVVACIVYHLMQAANPLRIPFENGSLVLHYGWSFWLCLGAGLFAFCAGSLLLIIHTRYPHGTNRLFLVSESYLDGDKVYDYSPGPLKIDTPYSRRMFRESAGLLNSAFILEDLPSIYRRTNFDDIPPVTPTYSSRTATSCSDEQTTLDDITATSVHMYEVVGTHRDNNSTPSSHDGAPDSEESSSRAKSDCPSSSCYSSPSVAYSECRYSPLDVGCGNHEHHTARVEAVIETVTTRQHYTRQHCLSPPGETMCDDKLHTNQTGNRIDNQPEVVDRGKQHPVLDTKINLQNDDERHTSSESIC